MNDTTATRADETFNHPSAPICHAMSELPEAAEERAKLVLLNVDPATHATPLSVHLSQGLAYTVGSAIGCVAPSVEACLAAFESPNRVGLTAGARAWSKHGHRSRTEGTVQGFGWWGRASGPVPTINANALTLFWRVLNHASWRNLHWLPHQILVYEVRVPEGYGMRWAQDRGSAEKGSEGGVHADIPWMFRGFLEPMMENGHELGWRHAA